MIETTTISSKGQVTVPLSFREKLGLNPGTKVAFVDGEDGNVYIMNASVMALREIQAALSAELKNAGFKTEQEAIEFAISVRKG